MYVGAQQKATAKACYIEEKLQISSLKETEKSDLLSSLAIENELVNIFKIKLKKIEKQAKKFDNYYGLLLAEIKEGSYVRNRRFQEENAYLFE